MNDDYDPSENEERILSLFKQGRDEGDPWGYLSPDMVKRDTEMNDHQINYALNQLIAAGWAERVNKGVYRLRGDPRDD